VAKATAITGLTETIRELNKIEPGLRKQFTRDAERVASPAIEAAKAGYTQLPLSGMARNWSQKNKQGASRRIFPFTVSAARRGVKLKVDARRDAVAVMFVQQVNRGAAVFEAAGRTTKNALGDALGPLLSGQTRVIGPRVLSRRREITEGMVRVVREYERKVSRAVR
jgi:hypothetical protein